MRFCFFIPRVPTRHVVLISLIGLVACVAPAAAQSDPQEAIDAGRRALRESGGFWGIPWYDAAADQLRSVDVPPERNWNWLEGWLEWLEDVFGFTVNWDLGQFFATVGWILVAILLGVLVWLIIRAYLNNESLGSATAVSARQSERGHLIDRVEALPVAVRDPHADFLAEARRFYQAGNFSEAIIYLFSYQLLELDKHNLLRLAKGKTNRQYLREVTRSTAVRPIARLFERSMLLFEASFFGDHSPQGPTFEALWHDLGSFQSYLAQQPERQAK